MKVIGITCGINKEQYHSKHYVNADYVNAILNANALPVLIPVTDNEDYLNELMCHIDGLLVTGGEDVNPMVYNENYHFLQGNSCLERDMFDISVIRKCIQNNKPILGICRGIQVINVALGGTLYQDISEVSKNVYNHRQKEEKYYPIHFINNKEDSFLYSIFGEKCAVNSFHHQCIKELGEGLKIVSTSQDGIIEAIEHDTLPIYAVQFHPEMMATKNEQMQFIFNHFIDKI